MQLCEGISTLCKRSSVLGKRNRSGPTTGRQRPQSYGHAQPLQANRLGSTARLARWFSASLDIIARQRATKEPMENVVQKLVRSYHLGSKERKQVGDACFSFARAARSIEEVWEREHREHGGRIPDRRTRDHLGLLLVRVWHGGDIDTWPPPPGCSRTSS